MDLAESSKKKLVWQAVIRAVVGDNFEKNFELANKGIARNSKTILRPNSSDRIVYISCAMMGDTSAFRSM